MGYIQGVDRKQAIMFPEYIEDYVKEDNLARIIDAYVEQLDLNKLGFQHASCPILGRPLITLMIC